MQSLFREQLHHAVLQHRPAVIPHHHRQSVVVQHTSLATVEATFDADALEHLAAVVRGVVALDPDPEPDVGLERKPSRTTDRSGVGENSFQLRPPSICLCARGCKVGVVVRAQRSHHARRTVLRFRGHRVSLDALRADRVERQILLHEEEPNKSHSGQVAAPHAMQAREPRRLARRCMQIKPVSRAAPIKFSRQPFPSAWTWRRS